jgi:hypothetical protein
MIIVRVAVTGMLCVVVIAIMLAMTLGHHDPSIPDGSKPSPAPVPTFEIPGTPCSTPGTTAWTTTYGTVACTPISNTASTWQSLDYNVQGGN